MLWCNVWGAGPGIQLGYYVAKPARAMELQQVLEYTFRMKGASKYEEKSSSYGPQITLINYYIWSKVINDV